MSTVQIEKKERYSILTIDRPQALNALNATVLSELKHAVQAVAGQPDQRAIIVTGAGAKAFVAGADIAAMQEMSSGDAHQFAQLGHACMNAIAHSRLISVAAVNGFALGGGMELALACDMRFGADSARVGLPEVTLGLIPGFGGTQRLARLVGAGLAMEIILSGEMILAPRAAEIGLLNRIYPAAQLLEETEKFVQTMLSGKSFVAQASARRVIAEGLDQSLARGLETEIEFFAELFKGEHPRLGMSAFLSKQKPDF
ncbi:MAG: enoyl-CoA hydratase/isomerase family protein [Leptospirales bacterium]|nr:enoyl-CoA hydratase/isomerase family protein [Leptospirales bacterium]